MFFKLFIVISSCFFGSGSIPKQPTAKNWETFKASQKSNVKYQAYLFDRIRAVVAKQVAQLQERGWTENEALTFLYTFYDVPRKSQVSGSSSYGFIVGTMTQGNLATLLLRKEMHKRGYAYSGGGVDAPWQENIKRDQATEAVQKKYDWL